MRVISWNMKNKLNNWRWFSENYNADIALLQEAYDYKKLNGNAVKLEVKKQVNNYIFSTNNILQRIEFPKQLNQDFVCAKTPINGIDIFLLSIYGNLKWHVCKNKLCEKKRDQWFTIFSGQLSMIITYLRRTEKAKNIIIAGDFNCERRMDDNPTSSRFAERGERLNNLFFDLINDLGFKNCVRKFHPEPIRTHKHNKSTYPWEIDHMFCTNEIYEKLTSVEVDDSVVDEGISDHNPIIANFSI